MKKKNYLSAFDAILHVYSCVGQEREEISWPDFDWVARFRTTSEEQVYIASNIDGVLTNCFNDNGRIHVIFVENHGLEPGEMSVVFDAKIPNKMYPGGKQREVTPQPMDIELVRGRGDCGTLVDIDILVPYIQFKYADLTPEEKAELSKPATDAAASVAALEKQVSAAERQRVLNEATRLESEAGRLQNEAAREANEQSRKEAEDTRRDFETARQAAEHTRTQQFTEWESSIDNKADRSELSNVLAEEPLTTNNFHDINTYTREELKKDLFIDMWNTKCIKPEYGCYDPDNAPDAEHPFFLNELWLTYKEALAVDMYSTYAALTETRNGINIGMGLQKCRTLYPLETAPTASLYNLTGYSRIEIIRIIPYYSSYFNCSDLRGAFSGPNMRKVFGTFNFPQVDNPNYTIYTWCGRNMEEFSGAKLKCSMSVSNCPKLNLYTFQFMIANANNGTTPITITVHPDVYAKLTDEANAEWHQVLKDAAAKNINFATT